MKDVLIVGAGGAGREILHYAEEVFTEGAGFRIRGFIDDNPQALKGYDLRVGVVGGTRDYRIQEDERFLIAIGEPQVRRTVARRMSGRGARYASLVHPTAWVASSAQIDEGCIIGPFAFVGPFSWLQEHTILNTYASVGHDCRLGPCCTLCPYSVVNGQVELSQGVFMGTHASVLSGKRVGDWSKVAAGAVVYRNLGKNVLAAGNPARAREIFRDPESSQ